jgi:glycerophosphoryl diester phosphodiesterase
MRARPIVIAHRGASGYLPEHTLAGKALAFGMGADYLEQDVVATRDRQLIVFHDLTLEQMTDVAARYPGRARADGHFYCIDFDLEEIRTLTVGERRAPQGARPRYPGRFPDGGGRFGIPTLDEELRFVGGLIRSTGRSVGIYPEIKNPAWHREQGIDIGPMILELLARHGYAAAEHAVFVQCFEPAELQRLRQEGCRLRLVQLIDSRADAISAADLARIGAYANAIGPSISLIYRGMSGSQAMLSPLVRDAHAAGLDVHPYTFRKDDLPAGITDFDVLLELFLKQLGVDGVFTDFPDLAAGYVARHLSA